MNKTYSIPTTRNYFRSLIVIMDFIPPFSKLRPQTKDVLAELFAYYHLIYGEYPIPERNTLLFTHDCVQEMATNIGLKINIFQNNIGLLKKEGLILSLGYNKNVLNEKYILPELESITFKFEEDDNSTGK